MSDSPDLPPVSPAKRPRPRWIRHVLRILAVIGLLLLFLVSAVGLLWWYLNPAISHEEGIVYGERHGEALTYDVLSPARGGNGYGIVFMVSGGWKSKPGSIRPWLVAPLLRKGYTVFAVCHVSQPQASVMEIVEDVNRAVRTIRRDASRWAIDPDRIGVCGGSSGGHLSLMLATRGGPGDPTAEDPIDRESSAVQAAAVFFPVTDLLNLGDSTENLHDNGPPKSFRKAFGPGTDRPEIWEPVGRGVSPIYHISAEMPPILIYHGDADTLVPVDQSTRFQTAAEALGANVELIICPGKSHGWLSMIWDIRIFGRWYEDKLQ